MREDGVGIIFPILKRLEGVYQVVPSNNKPDHFASSALQCTMMKQCA